MNVVLTCLFTGSPDPQRGLRLPADVKMVAPLLESLSNCEAVVFHDELDTDDPRFYREELRLNVYFQRWACAIDWLCQNPDAEWVWCVDGTDVVMLHEPWAEMKSDTLYAGSEPQTVGFYWLADNHPSVREWAYEHRDEVLLNAGLVGGDRATMLKFLLAMMIDRAPDDLTDMGVFNKVARSFAVITGEGVHTRFRAYDHDHQFAWWAHK